MYTMSDVMSVFFPHGRDAEMATEMVECTQSEFVDAFFQTIDHIDPTDREIKAIARMYQPFLERLLEEYEFQRIMELDTGYSYLSARD